MSFSVSERYAPSVGRTLAQRIHNPHNYDCGCLPECWCNRTAIGRLVKWWFPARWFGIHHRNAFFDGMTTDEIQAWKQERWKQEKQKQEQERTRLTSMVVQPRYESLVRLGPRRYGLAARQADGTRAIHEITGSARLDTDR